ncbi:YDG domain-containing protein At5g47150-like [Bidens hawaiensis]|uniref:YDG domain-containing protein At5g47150-like n=1 Tax=Bidens hawaiensis TaxID=980011 RepID=UPI00404B12CB
MTTVSQKENAKCEKIKEVMNVFEQVYPQLLQEDKVKVKGEKIAHWKGGSGIKLTNAEMDGACKELGPVCGVHIRDKFKYQAHLKMIGLHCQLQSGHGGLQFLGPKSPPDDLELKLGNLTLKNSMDERIVIRVIKKLQLDKN